MTRLALTLPLLVLAACGSPAQFYPTPSVATDTRVATRYRAVQIAEVSLPSYAASEEIFVQGADGALSSAGDLLWADLPARAMTLALSRTLAEITGARAAPEPWPFESLPDARLEIQVEDLLAEAGGTLLLSGQYFLASGLGAAGDRAGPFRLTRAFDPEGGAAAIARARAEITTDLAVLIAQDALR